MIDVPARHLQAIRTILHSHVPDCSVILFGSRVTGPVKKYSDLDIALKGKGPVPVRTMAKLKTAFSESNIPFKVDVIDWDDLSDSFKKRISPNSEILC